MLLDSCFCPSTLLILNCSFQLLHANTVDFSFLPAVYQLSDFKNRVQNVSS